MVCTGTRRNASPPCGRASAPSVWSWFPGRSAGDHRRSSRGPLVACTIGCEAALDDDVLSRGSRVCTSATRSRGRTPAAAESARPGLREDRGLGRRPGSRPPGRGQAAAADRCSRSSGPCRLEWRAISSCLSSTPAACVLDHAIVASSPPPEVVGVRPTVVPAGGQPPLRTPESRRSSTSTPPSVHRERAPADRAPAPWDQRRAHPPASARVLAWLSPSRVSRIASMRRRRAHAE